MFDASRLSDAIDEILGLLRDLGAGAGWAFGTIGLEIRLHGRGVPKSFADAILAAGETGAASAHARMTTMDILQTRLPKALRELRATYAAASGGLPREEWMQATFEFCLANGGTAALNRWELPDLKDTRRGGEIPLSSGISRASEVARRLSAHASLDLAGPLRHYDIAKRNNSALPYRVAAPDAAHAVARLSVLMDCDPAQWTHLREVHDAEVATTDAIRLLARR